MIDWKFIEELEGKNILHGYVPLDRLGNVIGQSGVTIGTGVDLGQMDRGELVTLLRGEPDSFNLLSKLLPYVGIKTDSAINALKRKPLEITEGEAVLLSKVTKEKILKELVRKWTYYNHTDFYKLPDEAQTVLFSLAYNFGSNLPERLPNTWDAFVRSSKNNDWQLAVSFMMQFPSKNKELDNRRRREAFLLSNLLRLPIDKDVA